VCLPGRKGAAAGRRTAVDLVADKAAGKKAKAVRLKS